VAAPSVERLLAVIDVQNEVASSGLDLEEVMRLVVRRAQELTAADAGVVELVEGDEMVYRAASGSAAEHVGLRLATAASLSGRCVLEDRPLRCDDADEDSRVDAEACRRVGARSMVCVPLRHADRAVGVLKVSAGRPHGFDEGDLAVLRLLSAVIATRLAQASAHAALREAEDRFRSAFDHALVGMSLTAPDGRLLQVNAALCAMLGRSAEELRRCRFRDITHPDDRARDVDLIRRTLDGELPGWQYEKRYLHATGRTVLVALTTRLVRDAEGAPLYFVTQMQDITERRAAERRAAAQFAATQALAAGGGVDEALRRVAGAVCEHLDWAAGALWLTGPDGALVLHEAWSPDPALRAGLLAPGTPACSSGERALAAQVVAGGRPAWCAGLAPAGDGLGLRAAFCVPVTSGDRVLGALEFHATQPRPRDRALLEAMTTIGGYVGQSLERERAQRELAEARDEALRASEMKSRFLANTSHEIRTPMNGVLGMTELLLDSSLTAEQRAQAETVRASAETLLRVIDDILDLSKIEAGRLELGLADLAPRDVVRDVCALLAPRAADAGLALRAEVDPAVPELVRSDGVRLRQVLTNLVGNAVKFTERGEVVVALSSAPAADGRALLRLAVRDTGIGIGAQELPRLFDAFSQVDPSTTRRAGGTGLGLAISHQLVEMLGGRIDVRSRPGAGSTFTVELPVEVLARVPRAPARAAAPADGAAGAGRTVLVAEDNPVNQRVAELTLRRRGWEVVVVPDGRQAVERARERRFDVVLMDCQMPELDGYAATRAIREAEAGGPRTPIIAMTAHSMAGDRERCLEAGMDDHLTKPFRPDELDAVLARGLPAAV
jgi:PAS domain S-box-containing protein